MAIYYLISCSKWRKTRRGTSGFKNRIHHQFAIEPRVALRPSYRLDVLVEVLGAFFEIGEIPIRQIANQMAHILFCQLDEICSDAITNSARAAVQHQPYAIALVEADLDKMIARAERAQMRGRMRVARDLLMLRDNSLVAFLERGPLRAIAFRCIAPRAD